MNASISSQVVVFFWCIFGGIIIGLLFDVFRLSRKIIPTNDVLTYIEDIVFWLLVGVIVLTTIFQCNQGQLRGFVFLGMLLGTVFYFMLFSNLIMRFIGLLFSFFEKKITLVINFLRKPIKILTKIIEVPMKSFLELVKKVVRKIYLKCKKIFFDIKRSKKIIKEKV